MVMATASCIAVLVFPIAAVRMARVAMPLRVILEVSMPAVLSMPVVMVFSTAEVRHIMPLVTNFFAFVSSTGGFIVLVS